MGESMFIFLMRHAGYFGQDKTIEEVEHQFYWPGLKRGIAKIVGQCCTCQLAKYR